MKQLQNNFTTPEQSNRLLGFGVPADSADCYYYDWAWIGEQYEGRAIQCLGYGGYRHEQIIHTKPIYPCWSVGRLIEVYNICANSMPDMELDLNHEPEGCTYIELIIESFQLAADDGLFDFSKLED